MPAKVSWYQEPRILYAELVGNFSTEDTLELNQLLVKFIRSGEPPVHLVYDATKLGTFPLKANVVSNLLSYTREPNMGKSAVIGTSNKFVHFVASIVTNAAGIEMKMVNSMEDALSFLKRADITL